MYLSLQFTFYEEGFSQWPMIFPGRFLAAPA